MKLTTKLRNIYFVNSTSSSSRKKFLYQKIKYGSDKFGILDKRLTNPSEGSCSTGLGYYSRCVSGQRLYLTKPTAIALNSFRLRLRPHSGFSPAVGPYTLRFINKLGYNIFSSQLLRLFCLLSFAVLAGACSTRPEQRENTEVTDEELQKVHSKRYDTPPCTLKGYCYNGGTCHMAINIERRPVPVCSCPLGFKGRQCEDRNDPNKYFTRQHGEIETAALSSLVTFVIVATCFASIALYLYRRYMRYAMAVRDSCSDPSTPASTIELYPFSPKRTRGGMYRLQSNVQNTILPTQFNSCEQREGESTNFLNQSNNSQKPENLDLSLMDQVVPDEAGFSRNRKSPTKPHVRIYIA